MATVFLGLVTVLSEFGLGSTIVYRRDLTEEQLDQLNSLAIIFGIAAFMVSCVMGAPLAWFFKTPQLRPVVISLGIGFVISSFQVVPYGLLQREQAFKRLAYADAGRMVTQAATTIGLAYVGFGYWALVIGSTAGATVSVAILRRARPQRFAYPRLVSLRSAVAFSRDVIVARLSWYAYSNADFAVAGRVLGATELGAYTVAWNLASTSIDKLTDLVSRVAPAFVSEAQLDTAALRRYVRALTEGISLITFPTTLGLALIAREGVLALLGARWQSAIAPLRLLALYAAIRSITMLLSPVMSALDLRWAARYSVAFPVVFPAAFYVGSRWGIEGIAAGWVLLYPIMYIPIYRRLFRNIAMRPREYARAIWPAVNASVAMGGGILVVKANWSDQWPLILFVIGEIAIGAVLYLTVLVTAHRERVVALWRACAVTWREAAKPAIES